MKFCRTYPAVLESLDAISSDAEVFCESAGIGADTAFALNLCLEEIFTNCARYGCGLSPDEKIEISLEPRGSCVLAEISDSAAPFDPLTQAPTPDTAAGADESKIGGLGVFLVKKYA